MNVFFVVTNTKRKSLIFITEKLEVLSLTEMVTAVKNHLFEKLYLVTGTSGTYIRSTPDKTAKNNIDTLSITGPQLALMVQGHANSTPLVKRYTDLYLESPKEGAPYITPVGSFRIPSAVVKRVFQSHATIIKKAAKEFGIDQNTLGAIIVDEIARLYPFEPILEKLAADVVGRNVSVGVAQVKIETANDLILKEVYTPNINDSKLPFKGQLTNGDRRHLYDYVIQPKHNIRFAAAVLRYTIDYWSLYLDLSDRPEILGTLYRKGYGEPKKNPATIARGEQIAGEFYTYAKQWLK